MADSPTIVVASLSDEELRKSVNNLVKDVNGAVNQMATNFDNTIASMRQTLQSFGNVKFDFGGKASGKSKLASELKEQTDAMNKQEQAAVSLGKVLSDTSDKENKAAQTKKNLALTSDQEALALEKVTKAQRDKAAAGKADMQVVQNAISDSERLRNMYTAQAAQAAKRFDVSGIQTLRMREHELEAGIKSASDMAKRAKKDVDDLNNSIESYRRTMTSLPNDKNGFAQRQDIQKLINETIVLRDVALDEQKKWETSARQLSAQYENVKSQIRTMGQNLIEAGKAEDSAVESAKRHTDEIRKQAEEIRKSKYWQEKGFAVVGDYVVKDPERFTGSKKEKQTLGTLEEQILNIKKQQTKEIDNQIEKERQLGNEIKKTNSVKPISYREDLMSYLSSRGVRSFDYLQDSHVEQYKKMDLELEKLKSKYDSLGDSAKKSEEGMRLSSDIDAMIQRRTDFLNKLSMQLKDVKAKSSDPFSSLRNSISQALGVTQESIRLFDTETASISKLQKELKILQSAYQNLSPKKISAGEGDAIAAEIQKVQRAMQLMQNQMSRPVNLKSALGLSEKTIDDIAYKMRQLSAYRTGLDITDPKQILEMKQAEAEIDRLKRKYDELMGKNKQMIGSNTALGRSWNYMKNRLAFYFSVGASTAFVKNLIEVRSQYEMNERALGILINSAERGTQIFNELSQMSLVSPYTLIELSTAAKQLTAYDVAAKNVVDTTRRLADMASAVGIPIERLTYALGQIKAYGYLNSRDARMFSNAGIPLVKQLADYYTELEGKMVSTADVYDRMKKKAIDYNEVMSVIYKMTDEGGKFFDFQAKMADTLKVRLANLTLAWNNMLNDIGSSEQNLLTGAIGALRTLFLHWKDFKEALTTAGWATAVIVAIRALNVLLVNCGFSWKILNREMKKTAIVGTKATSALGSVKSGLISLVRTPLTWWALLAFAIVDATKALIYMNEAQENLNKSIRDSAKSNYDDISKFLEQYKSVRDSLYKTETRSTQKIGSFYDPATKKKVADSYATEDVSVGVSIDKEEAKKAWEAVREQIELTTKQSEQYITSLLAIGDLSERLRRGFDILDDIKSVNASLKELDDNTIKITTDWSKWWNLGLLPDGLIENLSDYERSVKRISDEYGGLSSLIEATKVSEGSNLSEDLLEQNEAVEKAKLNLDSYNETLSTFREDLKKTTDSIIAFINLKGWSGDTNKISEVFSKITQKITVDNNLNPEQAFLLQTEMEEARSKAAKLALYKRIKDEKAALDAASDEQEKKALARSINTHVGELKSWEQHNGRKKVEWERFTAWLKEQHISETTAMFRDMEAKDIKSINFMEGKHADWVNRMVTQYAKEHKMSIDDVFGYLKDFVDDANTWSVTIPVMLDIKEQSDFQKEFNKRVKDTYGTTTLNFASIAPEQGQDLPEWTKKRQESLEKLHTAEKEYARDNTEWGKQQLRNTRDQIALEKKALDLFGQKYVKDKKGSGNKKDKVLEDLKMEIDLIKKAQSEYDKLTKAGYTSSEALKTVRGMYSKTISLLNTKMAAYGLPKIDLSMIEGKDPNKVLDFFTKLKALLESKGLSNLERMKAVEGVINEFTVSAKTYNMEKITKGIEKELGKLKNEYDLSIELEATPEMGNMFAQMFGINKNQLPKSFEQLVKRAQDVINNELSKNKFTGVSIDIDSLLNKNAWDKFVKSYGGEFENDFIKSIENVRNYLNEARKKEASESIKAWQSLISKYGDIRSKMLKIYKDSVKEQIDIVNRFGSIQQKEESAKIMAKVTISDSPEDIAKLQEEVSAMIKNISVGTPAVLDISKSITNKQKSDTSKAMWEDFKGGDLYTATFEDMSRMSTSAIQMILDKLEVLKDKVKDDPASMKALMKSMKDARDELESRSPYTAIVDGINELKDSYKEVKDAEKALSDARKHQEGAQVALQMAEAVGDTNDIAIARERLAEANKNVETAELNLSKAQSKTKSAFTKIQNGMKGLQDQLGNVSGAFSAVSNMFKKFGDDDTAEAIDAINEGFSVMTSVISAVIAVMLILETEQPILLAIAATLGVIIGLANMLSGVNDKKITKQIEDSQRAVRRLELAYIDLQHAIDDAYGSATIGAKKAAVANKELQLAELKRQLSLEESRSGKKRDQGKIDDLKKQVKELEYEIKDAADEIVNDLLGISSVGDAMESLMGNFIDALRNGEDAMKVFGDSIDDMIANMIKKMFVSKVLAPWFEEQWNTIQKQIDARAKNLPDKVAEISNRVSNAKMADENNNNSLVDGLRALGFSEQDIHNLIWYDEKGQYDEGQKGTNERLRKAYREALSKAEKQQEELNKQLTDATTISVGDIRQYAELLRSGQPIMEGSMQEIQSLLEELGLINSSTDENLSALQQGIQGITEETAGALEAYANSISQQVYLQSDLLTQIRDVIVNIDYDIHLDLQAQILLQMQQSYQVQMAIHNLLNNTLNPSGMAFNVNILS